MAHSPNVEKPATLDSVLPITHRSQKYVLAIVLVFVMLAPIIFEWQPNGLRYPLVGGTRQRRFDGINLKLQKLPKNAPTPTSRVHAVLGAL